MRSSVRTSYTGSGMSGHPQSMGCDGRAICYQHLGNLLLVESFLVVSVKVTDFGYYCSGSIHNCSSECLKSKLCWGPKLTALWKGVVLYAGVSCWSHAEIQITLHRHRNPCCQVPDHRTTNACLENTHTQVFCLEEKPAETNWLYFFLSKLHESVIYFLHIFICKATLDPRVQGVVSY